MLFFSHAKNFDLFLPEAFFRSGTCTAVDKQAGCEVRKWLKLLHTSDVGIPKKAKHFALKCIDK
jgi:hypothetical protein